MPNFVDSILAVFSEVFAPLIASLKSPQALADLLANLGWAVDPAFATGPASGVEPIAAPFTEVETAFTSLSNDIQSQAYANVPADVAQLITAIGAVTGPLDLTGLLQPFDSPVFWQALPVQLYPYLLYAFLQNYAPVPFGILRFLGVLQAEPMTADDTAVPPTIAYTKYTVNWDNLYAAASGPQAILPSVYGWGSGQFDHAALLDAAADLFRMLPIFRIFAGSPAVIQASSSLLSLFYDPASLPADGFEMLSVTPLIFTSGGAPVIPPGKIALIALPIPATTNGSPPPTGIALFPLVTGGLGTSFNVTDDVTVTLNGDFQTIPVIAQIQPGSSVTVNQDLDASTTVDAEARLDASAPSTGGPLMLFGTSDSSYLSFSQAHLRLVANGPVNDLTYEIDAGFDNAQLVIQFGDADSFIGTFFGGQQQSFKFGVSLTWSNKTGFGFHGQSNLQIDVPIHQTILGVVTITNLSVSLVPAPGEAQGIAVPLSVSGNFTLGPLSVSVQQIGLEVDFTDHQTDHAGSFGDVDVQLSFKPPDGLGLALDAGVATGGGYIECDAGKGQYAGVLELALESLSLTAIGLIQTKMADGAPLPGGFSLLVIISVDFAPGVELGFGFTLNGVGGDLGLNRTMNVDALRAGVRSGSLDDIMFPVDPVGHAPQLIQELGGFFPAAPGRFLIGPMVQIQWGSPLPILTADLGVLVELPAPIRVAVLGVLDIGLPEAGEDAVVLLNLDVLGVVDFGLGTLSLDASLFGSRIAEFPVSGDMALRLGWKAEREFIAALGGCHPAFTPPPGFPALSRLAISLSSSDKFTFTLQAYLATTSNTIQFGAKAHLLADTGQARLDGMMSFDALIHTSPFGLEVDFAAAVTVWIDGQQLLAVTVTGQLTGPAPWQISAQASIHVFFISATVSFQVQLGSAAPPPPPAPVWVINKLATDVQNTVNWSALPPPGESVVTLTSAPTSGTEMRAHPLGSLTFHQRTVPLEVTIEKFGAADIAGPTKLALTSITYGTNTVDPASVTPVADAFAPGQFLRLSDTDALSQPAFATYQAGVTFTPTAPDLDHLAASDVAPVSYTVGLIDSHGQLPASPPPPLGAQATARLIPTGPAAHAPSRTTGPRRYQGIPGTITVNPRTPAGRNAP